MRLTQPTTATLLAAALLAGCGDDDDHGHDHGGGNENEVLTTVALTFTPAGGGTAIVAEFDDPDGDGGDPPTIDDIDLPAGAYELAVSFQNRLEDPPEEITEEILDEADEHQVFFTGTAVDGPASTNPGAPLTHAYADEDGGGLPIGVDNTITAAAGTGELTVTLRHMPPVNDQPSKVAGLAEDVAAGGLGALPGSTDVSVTFDVTVP